jgi:predicted DNA-binding WGR domain protein
MTARTQLTTPLPRHIHLQAIDQARNVARDYQIEACLDLFGHWIVALHWGRIGTRGQSRVVSFAAEQLARRFVGATLVKRRSAKKRIGVAYLSVS